MAYLKLLPVVYFCEDWLTDVCHGSHNKVKKTSVLRRALKIKRIEAANAKSGFKR